MILLCDSCSVLMLLRINLDMFTDTKFECCTTKDVLDEIYKSTKLKDKYPWRKIYKNKIKYLPVNTSESNDDFVLTAKAINEITFDKALGLSRVDRKIAAYSSCYNYEVSTTDKPLQNFLEKELEINVLSPLAVINKWISSGAMQWSKELEEGITAWQTDSEPPQPKEDIKEYENLTGKKYTGV